MKILIACRLLSHREGAMMFSRELALALHSRGHTVMLYTSDASARETLPENAQIPVLTDVGDFPFRPDIIHGQTHLDTMASLMALPGVPALYHCHGAIWSTCVPKHPRIYRYLAMSRTLAERMMAESNIAEDDLSVFLTPVNMAHFKTLRNLPAEPAKALFFNSRHHPDSPTVGAVREAASRCGLELDFVGLSFGKTIDNPQEVLPSYDIVFASGIAAIEAVACGCAVVVLGRTRCGEMVLPENYERTRQVNFSIASNLPSPSPEMVETELRRYSAEACTQVTQQLRRDADFAPATREFESIYQAVIGRHQRAPRDLRAESLANSKYLRKITPLVRISDGVLDGAWPSAAAREPADPLTTRLDLVERAVMNPDDQEWHSS